MIVPLNAIIFDGRPTDWIKWLRQERKYLRRRYPDKEYFPDDYYEKMEAWWSSSMEARLIDPLLVVPLENGKFHLEDGHHRYAISIKFGIKNVPILIKS